MADARNPRTHAVSGVFRRAGWRSGPVWGGNEWGIGISAGRRMPNPPLLSIKICGGIPSVQVFFGWNQRRNPARGLTLGLGLGDAFGYVALLC